MEKRVEWSGTRWVGMVESEEKAGPGVEPGRRGGSAREAGRPLDSGGTWCSGGERAPPRVPSPHWAARPGPAP